MIDPSATPPHPRRLIVVGAAAGMGRVLTQHLFAGLPWDQVILIDQPQAATGLATIDGLEVTPTIGVITAEGLRRVRGDAELEGPGTAVCLAVPVAELATVAAALLPQLDDDAVVFDTTNAKQAAVAAIAPHLGARRHFGIHPLFDVTVRGLDGQTIVVTSDDGPPPCAAWLVEAAERRGAIVKHTTPARHDRSMAYVQTMAQQALLAFADAALAPGLDPQGDLWDMRTPAFETLLGLAVRTISEHQQRHVASTQSTAEAGEAGALLNDALARVRATVAHGDAAEVADYVAALRDRLSGSLFETVHATAGAVVGAAQAQRATLSRHRRDGTPVGLVTHERPDEIRVGRIVYLTPTEVHLDELLVGSRGEAVMLSGEGTRNARKLGVGGKPRRTRFGLGRVEVVTGPALDAALDAWLVHIRRDIRFLVPESVAGAGIVHVIAEVPRVSNPQVVSEVVRTGQRAVVIRVEIRADADVDATVEDLRARVGEAYAWPAGLSLPRSAPGVAPVSYLGPTGTFSETGARHCAASLGLAHAPLTARVSFEQVLEAAHDGEIAVLPICSSASGLVERAAAALLSHGRGLEAGGVVDVPVRFDAYVPEGVHLEDLRGADVLSHPQALRQCARFVRRWGLRPVEVASTAEAGRIVAARDTPAVAIAGAGLGDTVGLRVAESEVDDLSGSLTRFLVVGRVGTFGALAGGSDPTLRSLWVADDATQFADVLTPGGPAFDELITGPSGQVLLVTSRVTDSPADVPGRITLGRLPWTPRTPLVRLEA